MKLLATVILIVFLFGCSTLSKQRPKEFSFGSKRPIVAAHRAEHSIYSENSLPAIESAQREKISLIEIDIRESLDGQLFLFHNKNVDPHTVEGPNELVGKAFSSLTSAQIRSLVLPHGEKVPSFQEVLEIMKSQESALLLDIKGEAALREKVLSTVASQGLGRKFWFLCYSLSCINQVQERNIPGAEVIARNNRELSIAQALSINPKVVQVSCESGCRDKVREIKSADRSILVLATTLDESLDNKKHWRRVREEGVDIILTDRPLELKLLQSH
jgi:glycerophosphoryl diester phosphodiesterase